MSQAEPARRRVLAIVLILAVAALGIGSRRFGAVLPRFIAEYAGDTLWATAAFFGVGLLWPRGSTPAVAAIAMGISIAVELSQLYHAPWIDAVRRTTVGALALGSGFVASDLVCYAAGVVVGMAIDALMRWRRRRP